MSNHLIIGLGGTGGRVIRALRKTIYQEYRKHQPEEVNIEYLYIDSSSEMMAQDDPSWKTLGKTVQLSENQKLLIKGGVDLKDLLENINNYPGIKPWIGNKSQWQEILDSIGVEVLGSQKRRLGRFLFACKISEFKSQLGDRVRDLQNTGTTAVTFHICCGLAGGTGSGSIIDATAQIRSLYPDVKNFNIILYTLLPETHPKPNWDTGNYHANGYAALVELNALSVGAWKPHDITGQYDRLQLKDPFNGCYLFFNENENGLSIDTQDILPSIVADFLYQKLVVAKQTGWQTLGRMENAENGDSSPECAPNTQIGERSKRFLSFGIKRLIVPEQEIKEYMTYQFSQQAVRQILYNNWSDSASYTDEVKHLALNEEVISNEIKERWKLTKNHLCLSVGILTDEINNKKWRPINEEWQTIINVFKGYARDKPKQEWITELSLLCDRRFKEQYRVHGVQKFYETAVKRHKDHAKEIRQIIEKEIFGEWQNGTRSLHEIAKLIDALIESLGEQYLGCDSEITNYGERESKAQENVTANETEWAKVGIFSSMTGKHDKLLDGQAICLMELYINRTYKYAWQFSKVLLAALKTEINTLKTEIERSKSLFVGLDKEFKEKILGRINEEGHVDLRRPVVQFYQPEVVKEFTQFLLRDRRLQDAQSTQVRQILIDQLGDKPDFATFNHRLFRQKIIDSIELTCEKLAVDAHNNLIASERDKVPQINVSIIERLARDYSSNDDGLKNYMQQLVNSAGHYLLFNASEVEKKGGNISSAPTKVTQFSVILPKTTELPDFSDQLEAIIKGCYKGSSEFIHSDRRSEIVFISLCNLFPLRFVKQLHTLKKEYDSRIKLSNNKERANLEIYCEGDGSQYPPLFIMSTEALKQQGLPFVLIAHALEIIQNYLNPSTGKIELLLISLDEDGLENEPIRLGKTLVDAVEELESNNIQMLKLEVQKSLQNDYQHIDEQKKLKAKVISLVNDVKKLCKGNIDDPVYDRFRKAAKKANQIIAKGSTNGTL